MASSIVSALRRDEKHNSGDIIAFLPGFAEILKLEQLVSKEIKSGIYGRSRGVKVTVRTMKLHSETMDDENESLIWDEAAKEGIRLVAFASRIAATSVTLPSMQYAMIHPKSREKVLHSCGKERLYDSRMKMELIDQEAGRVARVRPGLVTFFGLVNDSSVALRVLQQSNSGLRPSTNIVHMMHASVEHTQTFLTSPGIRCLGDPFAHLTDNLQQERLLCLSL